MTNLQSEKEKLFGWLAALVPGRWLAKCLLGQNQLALPRYTQAIGVAAVLDDYFRACRKQHRGVNLLRRRRGRPRPKKTGVAMSAVVKR